MKPDHILYGALAIIVGIVIYKNVTGQREYEPDYSRDPIWKI